MIYVEELLLSCWLCRNRRTVSRDSEGVGAEVDLRREGYRLTSPEMGMVVS